MKCLTHRVLAFLPPRWRRSIERESKDWVVRCPCGYETSVWEMGGIRFKACGNPLRSVRCGKCGNVFVGQLFRRSRETQPAGPGALSDSSMVLPFEFLDKARPTAPAARENANAGQRLDGTLAQSCLVWIDGIGCYRLIGGDTVTIGSHSAGDDGADLKLLAPLSRRHAAITRGEESYSWQPVAEPKPRSGEGALLRSGDSLEVGGGVRLRLRVPSALSNTAVLDFLSPHRPVQRVDGVVLLEKVCILGPGEDAHIRCPNWTSPVVLFRRGEELWCRGSGLALNGASIPGESALADGAVLTGDDLRLRIELSCD